MKRYLWLFMIFTVYVGMFLLYNVDLEPICYATIICMVVLAVPVAYDWYQTRRKNKILHEMREKIIFSLDELPVPKGILEKEYQELLHILYDYKNSVINEAENQRTDMMDYYSLWVHQIKVPISAIRLLLSGRRENDETDIIIQSELFKIEQYVEMVLSYMRLESKSTDYMVKEYEINSIIKQAIRKYAPLFIQKKIKLNYEDIPGIVLTDEKWFGFVLEQVLSNAIKYTRQGSISIYLQHENDLVIEDTGIGISPEDLPRIGEKGFTGYNGRTDKKSTGLGMYLSKRVMTKLSHPLRVESEVGVGTKVIIGLERNLDTNLSKM